MSVLFFQLYFISFKKNLSNIKDLSMLSKHVWFPVTVRFFLKVRQLLVFQKSDGLGGVHPHLSITAVWHFQLRGRPWSAGLLQSKGRQHGLGQLESESHSSAHTRAQGSFCTLIHKKGGFSTVSNTLPICS